MILSDYSIRQRLKSGSLAFVPAPDLELQLQPASLDVRLGHEFVFFHRSRYDSVLDTRGPSLEDATVKLRASEEKGVIINPGQFALGTTLESVTMPNDLVARVEGRSSIGRLGLTVHVTAGFIDPGFKGCITLEIANLGLYPIKIYPGMRIAQLAFQSMTTPAVCPYGHELSNSKYQGQSSVTVSRITEERK